jgi:hypothetical protein
VSMHYGNTSPEPMYTKADPSTRNGGGGPPNPSENLTRDGDQDTLECPNCGSEVRNLPNHIGTEACRRQSNSESDQ